MNSSRRVWVVRRSLTIDRLLQNQTDIGNAVKPYYGQRAGNELTALLKGHINAAVAVLKAAKTGNSQAVATAAAVPEPILSADSAFNTPEVVRDLPLSNRPRRGARIERRGSFAPVKQAAGRSQGDRHPPAERYREILVVPRMQERDSRGRGTDGL